MNSPPDAGAGSNDVAIPRVRRLAVRPHVVSVAVQSSRDIVRAGLVSVIGRYPERLELRGARDTHLADVLLLDGHDDVVLAPDVAQRVVVIVDQGDDVVMAQQRWPGARVLTLDAGAHELVDALCTAEIAADPAPARWPGDELGLTRRESQVLGQLSMGRTNAEIAAALFVNVETVKSHLKQAYRRIGARNRVEAAAWAAARDVLLAPDVGTARRPPN